MAVTIDGREPLYAEMFSAVIDSNMHDRLALNWQTPFKRSGDGVLGCPSLLLSGQRLASSAYPSLREVAMSVFLHFESGSVAREPSQNILCND